MTNFPLDTGRKLNVHKTFRRRPGRLLNVYVRSFSLRPVSTRLTCVWKKICNTSVSLVQSVKHWKRTYETKVEGYNYCWFIIHCTFWKTNSKVNTGIINLTKILMTFGFVMTYITLRIKTKTEFQKNHRLMSVS